jgi:hypothetical protein
LAPVKGERSAQDIVGQMLDHAPGSHETLRYTLGAVPSALRAHVKRFPQRRRDARKDGVGITHLIPPK